MNLKELISNNFKEYEIIANKIVSDKDFLDKIKFKIKKSVLDSPLYNAEIFTKNLEIAYEKVFKNYIDNKDTRDFEI
jgi:predicted O-linked N-acetylglucosamine transferase (SPINDLY family)